MVEVTTKGKRKLIIFFGYAIDEALKRKPDVVLVDELVHTNAAGSRNEKIY